MFHVKIITTEKVDMTGTFLFKLVYSQFTIFSPPQSSLLQPPDTATLAVMCLPLRQVQTMTSLRIGADFDYGLHCSLCIQ